MAKIIQFSGNHVWDSTKDSMFFQVEVDGVKTRCLISREALEDHFGADQSKTVEQAFTENRHSIEDKAVNIINNKEANSAGEYLLYTQHI